MAARSIRGIVVALLVGLHVPLAAAEAPGRVTILYDAFGPPSELQKDWGFAALVEYGGKTPEAELRRVADALYNTLHVQRVAPGHCTSELGFSIFMERFKDRFDAAGLGAVIALP